VWALGYGLSWGLSWRLMTFSGAPASSEIEFPAPTFTLVNKFMLAGHAQTADLLENSFLGSQQTERRQIDKQTQRRGTAIINTTATEEAAIWQPFKIWPTHIGPLTQWRSLTLLSHGWDESSHLAHV